MINKLINLIPTTWGQLLLIFLGVILIWWIIENIKNIFYSEKGKLEKRKRKKK